VQRYTPGGEPWFLVVAALMALLAAGLLFGRAAGRDDQLLRVERRLADLEQAWSRAETPPSALEPEDTDVTTAVSKASDISLKCSTP
jgi:hypothetical protein